MTAPRVPIVDDNRLNMAMAQVVLQAAQFEVDSAVDGLVAEQKVASFRPDLMLMDIQAPGKGRLEVTRGLQADPAHSLHRFHRVCDAW